MKPVRFIVAAIVAASGVAIAQESAGTLQEIVVTSRKVEEKLQDIPLSVAAFGAAELEERGMDDLFKVSTSTPGFSFEKLNRFGVQGGGSRPVIRGQSNILGEANASIFIDGLLYSDSVLSLPFDIIERVEVIKGPQAALFGRATFAGAINLITKKGTNDFENTVSAKLAEYGDYEVNALSRGPLVDDKVFYMVHARYYEFGGMYKNSLDGQSVGSEQSVNLNASLEFRPSDEWMIRLNAGFGTDDDGAAAVALQDRTYNNCYLNVARQYYCGEVVTLESTEQNLDLFGDRIGLEKDAIRLSAQVEYDGGPWSLAWNTGYFNADSTYGYDVDITSNSTALGGTFNRIAVSDRTEISSELIFRTDETQRIRGLGGVYMYQSRRDFREDRLNGSTVNEGEQRIDNIAVFGALEADLSDRLTGRVELRYAEDKIGNNNPAARPTALTLIENTFTSTSPRVSLDYKLTDDNLVYIAAAKGNKPGYINSNPLLDPSLLFADEESAWNYEIGTKNTFRDGRTILNAAVYYIDWTNQQLTTGATLSTGAPVTVVVNIGETEVTGFEFELSNQFTDSFTGGFGFSYNDAEITSAYDAEQCQFNTPASEGRAVGCTTAPPTNLTFLNRGSLAGKQTPNSPKNQITAFGRYDFNVSDAVDGYFRVDYAYASKKFSQVFNLAHSGEQQLVNMKLGFDTANWKFSVFVDNLFDNRTPSTVIRFVDFKNPLPTTTVVPTTPADTQSTRTSSSVRGFQYPLADKRQVGMTVAYKF